MSNKSQLAHKIRSTLATYTPEIMTGLGISGMVTSTILAVTATPKALRLIEERKEELNQQNFEREINGDYSLRDHKELERLDFKETFKTVWRCYLPTAVLTLMSTACLIGASSVHIRRNAVLATAYRLSETAMAEYKNKVIETIGEKKEKTIRDEINKDKLQENPVNTKEIILTEKGNTLCYEPMSGRYFKSDIDQITKAINRINNRINSEFYVSLNDLYEELGLEGTALGCELGWNSNMGMIEANFSSQLASDGTPCLVLDVDKPPRYDYDRAI